MRFISAILLLPLFLMLGCDKQEWFDKFVPKEEAEVAKQVVLQFAARDYVAIERLLSSNLVQPDTRSKLEKIAEQVPQVKPTSVEVVGATTLKSAKQDQYTLTIQYQYPEKWLLANVVLQRNNGELRLAGVHVNQLADSLQNTNRFTFSGKGLLHTFVFLAAILVPLFIVASIITCIKTPMQRRKWLWLLLSQLV